MKLIPCSMAAIFCSWLASICNRNYRVIGTPNPKPSSLRGLKLSALRPKTQTPSRDSPRKIVEVERVRDVAGFGLQGFRVWGLGLCSRLIVA